VQYSGFHNLQFTLTFTEDVGVLSALRIIPTDVRFHNKSILPLPT